jgi:hypothetical protein
LGANRRAPHGQRLRRTEDRHHAQEQPAEQHKHQSASRDDPPRQCRKSQTNRHADYDLTCRGHTTTATNARRCPTQICGRNPYWADTITDGAIRLVVLFYFYERGYSPIAVATLFLFYEFFGIVTNLVGGWLAARLGLRFTLLGGLATQLLALGMLLVAPASWLVVPYVMVA